LLEQGVRIVMFSAGQKSRNTAVISELLTSLWGRKKYTALKAAGQFAIFSMDDTRWGNSSNGKFYQYIKDLGVVLRDGESLSDAVLVDDDPSSAPLGQDLYLDPIIKLETWYENGDHSREEELRFCNLAKINIYYMLGVFKTYFEHEKYRKLSFKEGLNQILPAARLENKRRHFQSFFLTKHPFLRQMIDVGLSEIRKKVPNATFYGLKGARSLAITKYLGKYVDF
jgi:hypothetical protein